MSHVETTLVRDAVFVRAHLRSGDHSCQKRCLRAWLAGFELADLRSGEPLETTLVRDAVFVRGRLLDLV